MNKGYPETEYIKVTNMNDQFQSYKFSVEKATKGYVEFSLLCVCVCVCFFL